VTYAEKIEACPSHQEVPVFTTRTGWTVTQCASCGAGDIVPPAVCGAPGCGQDHRRQEAP